MRGIASAGWVREYAARRAPRGVVRACMATGQEPSGRLGIVVRASCVGSVASRWGGAGGGGGGGGGGGALLLGRVHVYVWVITLRGVISARLILPSYKASKASTTQATAPPPPPSLAD